MPLSDGYKKIAQAWANSGDTTDPDAATLTPPVDISEGWDETFSGSTGISPRRQVFNEMFNRRDSALLDVRKHGVIPYDAAIPTPAGAIRSANNSVWQATEDTTDGPETPNQTSWRNIRPPLPSEAPSQVTGLVLSSHDENEVTADWNLTHDTDRRPGVSSYLLDWKYEGDSGWPTQEEIHNTTHTWKVADRTKDVQVRVRAVNSNGNGPVSETVTLPKLSILLGRIPTLPPSGINVGPVANRYITAYWNLPSEYFTHFDIAWSQEGGTEHLVSPYYQTVYSFQLANITADVTFRVRVAVANVGNGPWSDPIIVPADRLIGAALPDVPTVTSETYAPFIIDFEWDFSSNTAHSGITEYEWEWKYEEDTWSGTRFVTKRTFATITVPDASKAVNFRVRAKNVDGSSDWSTTHTVPKDRILDDPVHTTFNPESYQVTRGGLWKMPNIHAGSSLVYTRSTRPGDVNFISIDHTYSTPGTGILITQHPYGLHAFVWVLETSNTASNMRVVGHGTHWTTGDFDVPDLYGSGYTGSDPFTPISMVRFKSHIMIAATQSRTNPTTNVAETRTRIWTYKYPAAHQRTYDASPPPLNSKVTVDTFYNWTSYEQPQAAALIPYGNDEKFFAVDNGTLKSYQRATSDSANTAVTRVAGEDIPLTILPDVDTLAEAHVYDAFLLDNVVGDHGSFTRPRNIIMVWANTPGDPIYRAINTTSKTYVPEFDIQMPDNIHLTHTTAHRRRDALGLGDIWVLCNDASQATGGNTIRRYDLNSVSWLELGTRRYDDILMVGNHPTMKILTPTTAEVGQYFNISGSVVMTIWPRYFRTA